MRGKAAGAAAWWRVRRMVAAARIECRRGCRAARAGAEPGLCDPISRSGRLLTSLWSAWVQAAELGRGRAAAGGAEDRC